ncbi:MAG: response regulator [Methyloversatilis sp.]|nr:response regulator [Methyloversatilis sp.]MBP6195265.1 response regulator [Methyloversatilis sp.]MBP9118175.1 response regulator [Methyloversatilis sp.]
MKLSLETEILFRIALAIGDSMQLVPMVRRVLSETLRLLNASGGAVFVRDEHGRLDTLCMLPRTFDRSAEFRLLRERWPRPDVVVAQDMCVVDAADNLAHYLFDLPGFGMLVLERSGPRLEAGFLESFRVLTRKLSNACRACVSEEELIRQKHRLELATAAASIGIWELNRETGFLGWDAMMCALHGVGRDAAPEHLDGWMAHLDPLDAGRMRSDFENAHEGQGRFDLDIRVTTSGGELRVLRVLGSMAGSPGCIAGVALDVTTQQQSEQAMIAARDAAEAANRAKSEFLANMSHEIRTPMNGVLGMLDLAHDARDDAERREFIGIARSSADSLLAIINDILDFSKIEAGKIEIESVAFNLEELLAHAVRTMSAQASGKSLALQIEFDPELPRRVFGDPMRLRQVVLNLLSNAIKFTHAGGVTLRAGCRPDATSGSARLHIAVTDTGIGIPADKQARVFEAFAQQDSSTTRSFGGTGLGLSISSRLVDLMGGTIKLESKVGEGSTFAVDLPLQRADIAAPKRSDGTPEVPDDIGRSLHILLVEDHPVNQKVAQTVLSRAGHRVSLAANGLEAIEQVVDVCFDLVLMDMQMPVMGGLEAARLIRDMEREIRRPPVPIFAMTANAQDEDRQACLEAGMNDFLTKPLLPRVLRSRIAALAEGMPE